MTSDKGSGVPANEDNGFVRKTIVDLQINFTRQSQYCSRHLKYQILYKNCLHHRRVMIYTQRNQIPNYFLSICYLMEGQSLRNFSVEDKQLF